MFSLIPVQEYLVLLDASKSDMYTLLHYKAVCVHARAVKLELARGTACCMQVWLGESAWLESRKWDRLADREPAGEVGPSSAWLPALHCTYPVSVLGVLGGA